VFVDVGVAWYEHDTKKVAPDIEKTSRPIFD